MRRGSLSVLASIAAVVGARRTPSLGSVGQKASMFAGFAYVLDQLPNALILTDFRKRLRGARMDLGILPNSYWNLVHRSTPRKRHVAEFVKLFDSLLVTCKGTPPTEGGSITCGLSSGGKLGLNATTNSFPKSV